MQKTILTLIVIIISEILILTLGACGKASEHKSVEHVEIIDKNCESTNFIQDNGISIVDKRASLNDVYTVGETEGLSVISFDHTGEYPQTLTGYINGITSDVSIIYGEVTGDICYSTEYIGEYPIGNTYYSFLIQESLLGNSCEEHSIITVEEHQGFVMDESGTVVGYYGALSEPMVRIGEKYILVVKPSQVDKDVMVVAGTDFLSYPGKYYEYEDGYYRRFSPLVDSQEYFDVKNNRMEYEKYHDIDEVRKKLDSREYECKKYPFKSENFQYNNLLDISDNLSKKGYTIQCSFLKNLSKTEEIRDYLDTGGIVLLDFSKDNNSLKDSGFPLYTYKSFLNCSDIYISDDSSGISVYVVSRTNNKVSEMICFTQYNYMESIQRWERVAEHTAYEVIIESNPVCHAIENGGSITMKEMKELIREKIEKAEPIIILSGVDTYISME